jgi:hypothetical protein
MDLLCSKLKEFLDLEQGNHTVFDYTRQFNTLAKYGSYHVDTDDKKVNLYHDGLRMVHSPNLSYNDLVRNAINQGRIMKAVAEAEEKKKKRIIPGSSGGGGSSSAPSKYRMVYTPPGGQLHRPQQ